METIKIATLKINGVTTHVRKTMLEDFTRLHDMDIFFVQEVTTTEVTNISGYVTTTI
jgi:exonuclease III